MLYTNYQKYVKNAKRFDFCPECFEYGNEVRSRKQCVDCGRQFEITNREYDFYIDKGFDIPKRCKSCRDDKKNQSHSSSGGYSSQTIRHQWFFWK